SGVATAPAELADFMEVIQGINPYSDALPRQFVAQLETDAASLSMHNRETMLSVVRAGNDHIVGTAGADFISAYAGDDIVESGAGDDGLDGGDGNDRLSAGDGSDYLLGGSGNDELNGDNGDDLLM